MPKARNKGDRGDHFDAQFVKQLEELYERLGGEAELTRTDFAEKFLGVTYVSYCNWRRGEYPVNAMSRNSIESYVKHSDAELKRILKQRISD